MDLDRILACYAGEPDRGRAHAEAIIEAGFARVVVASDDPSEKASGRGLGILRDEGIEPEALIALLARLGTSDPVDPALDVDQIAASFDLSRFGRAPARFDEAELARVNAELVEDIRKLKAAEDDLLDFFFSEFHFFFAVRGGAAWASSSPSWNSTLMANVAVWLVETFTPVPLRDHQPFLRRFLCRVTD